ncbi:MAG: TadE/TadG family type IV pilus assembly protein [Acidimicrobiales bacterium]
MRRRTTLLPHRVVDEGSAAAELVLVTPLFLAFLGAFVAGSQLVLARQQVDNAVRAALEAAVISPTPQSARAAAATTATANVLGPGSGCRDVTVSTDTSMFEAGGDVAVTVSCSAALPGLAIVHLPSSVRLSDTAVAALEPYRAIGS